MKNENARWSEPALSEGEVVEHSMLAQLQPHTAIGEGVKGLIFRHCNLMNCDVPPDATVEHCNTAQKSLCVHLHPDLDLPAEGDDCEHVVDTVEVVVDGEVVLSEYIRQDKVVGR